MRQSTAPTAASWSRTLYPRRLQGALGLKDMRLVGEAADKSRVAMPLLSLVRDHLLETIAKEGEDIDWSGIGKTVARNAGLYGLRLLTVGGSAFAWKRCGRHWKSISPIMP